MLVINHNNQPVMITFDIENYTVVTYYTGVAIHCHDICRAFPIGEFNIMEPGLQ
jgi:hypothetical protein